MFLLLLDLLDVYHQAFLFCVKKEKPNLFSVSFKPQCFLFNSKVEGVRSKRAFCAI